MTMRRSASALAGLLVTLAGASRPAAAAPGDGAVWARAFDHGEYPRAIDLARRRLQAVPADTAARLVMSRAEAALGHFEAAYQGFRRVLSTDPRNTDALYYLTILGGVLAQAEYDRLFALAPDSPRARQLLGDLAVAQERPADAEAQYKAALQSAPDSLDLLLALGDLTRHQARFEEALAYYDRAARLAPRSYDALYGAGVCRSYRQEHAQAIESFRAALRLEPDSASARLGLGHALVQAGQTSAAVPELEKAVALEPRMLQAHYLLGRAYKALGRSREAEAAFAQVQKLVQSGIQASDDLPAATDPSRPAPSPEPPPESR